MTEITWSWLRFDELGVHRLYAALRLRAEVFILEQGPYLDPDGLDQVSWHLLGHDAVGDLRAYLRVVDPGHRYDEPSIGRVIISAGVRGSGIGRRLMEQGVARCTAAWPRHGIRISAQAHLAPFYRSLGFETVGDVYGEDNIPHVQMLRPTAP